MKSKWRTHALWIGAILIVFLATIFYQPAAARAGSLLVWTNNRVYVMDIDTLTLERVAPAAADETIIPSPGCHERTNEPCWVIVGPRLYRVDVGAGGSEVRESSLSFSEDYLWEDSAISWSPDGHHVAYSLLKKGTDQFDLHVIDVNDGRVKLSVEDIDPDGWYDLDSTLISYQKSILDNALGGRLGLIMLGKRVFPTIKKTTDQLETFKDPINIFKVIQDFYLMNNRGDDLGAYYTENINETSLNMRENVPHLTDFHTGMWEGIVRMYPEQYIFRGVEVLKRKEEGEPFSAYLVKYQKR